MTTDLMGGARNGKRAGLSPNNGTRSLQLDPARVVRSPREAGLGSTTARRPMRAAVACARATA